MTIKTLCPELNPNQRKLLYKALLEVIGDNEQLLEEANIVYETLSQSVRNEVKEAQRERLKAFMEVE